MKKIVLLFFGILSFIFGFSQVYVPGTHNGWAFDGTSQATLKSNFGTTSYYGYTFSPVVDGQFKIVEGTDYGNDWGGGYWITSYDQIWTPAYQGTDAIWKGSPGTYVHICIKNPTNYHGTNIPLGIMTLSAIPIDVSTVSQVGFLESSAYFATTSSQSVNITLSSAKSGEEKIYLRYTTDNWATDNFVLASGSGTSYSATIPAQSEGTTVSYYILTTTLTYSTGNDLDNDPDLMTINYNNNSGSNYSYTVSGPRSTASGNWNSTSTWLYGAVPTSSENVYILSGHSVTLTTDQTVNNLSIKFGGAVTVPVGKSLTINGTFSNSAGNSGLLIQSDASGNGSVIYSGTGQSATVQRYIAGYSGSTDGWHFLSSPVSSFVIAGSDFEPGASDDVFAYNESSNTWLNQKVLANNIATFTDGEAFLVAYSTTATKSFSGTLNNSNITLSNLSLGAGSGWHLLGNPFPSALIWNETAGDWALTNFAGVAKIWNDASDNYTDIVADGIIPLSNGFFVQATNATNSITIPTTARTHNPTNNYKAPGDNQIKIKVTNNINSYWDENTLGFRSHASAAFDQAIDSRKLYGGELAPQIWTTSEGEELSINYLPDFEKESSVPLHFIAGVDGNYQLTFQGLESFSTATQVILEDKQLNQFIDLNDNNEYAFDATTNQDNDRFILHFYRLAGVDENPVSEQLKVFSFNSQLFVLNPEQLSIRISLFDISGKCLLALPVTHDALINKTLSLPSGIYAIQILTENGFVNKKVFINQ